MRDPATIGVLADARGARHSLRFFGEAAVPAIRAALTGSHAYRDQITGLLSDLTWLAGEDQVPEGTAEALAAGLVNEIVPDAELDRAVDAWVKDILVCAPLSLRAIKRSAADTAHLGEREARTAGLPSLVAALESEDADEGVDGVTARISAQVDSLKRDLPRGETVAGVGIGAPSRNPLSPG